MSALQRQQGLVLDLIWAMLGAISPNFRAVALSLRGDGVLLTYVLGHDDPEDREEIDDIAFELEALQSAPLRVASKIDITEAPIASDQLPGLLVYRRREP